MLSLALVIIQLLMHSDVAQGNAVWLENVHCATYIDYVETDPGYARYLPFIVKLHRCQGSVGVDKPSVKACVPSNVTEVEIVTQNLQTFRYETIKVLNHTKCTSKCTRDPTTCTPFQRWNPKRCRCDCKTHGEPARDTCCAEKQWSKSHCGCVCRQPPRSCSHKRQEWSTETCGCRCKPKFYQRCAQLNLTLDLDTCKCMHNLVSNDYNQQGSRICYTTDTATLSLDVVILLCVAEALIIAFAYIIYFVGCRTNSVKRASSASTASVGCPKKGGKTCKRADSSNLLLKQRNDGGKGGMSEELQSQSTVFGEDTS